MATLSYQDIRSIYKNNPTEKDKGKTNVIDLLNDNVSLRRKNRFSCVGLVGLAALSLCAIGSCRKNTKELDGMRRENERLHEQVIHYQKDAADLSRENTALKHYANEADMFLGSIQPPYPTDTDFLTSLPEKEMLKKGEEIAQKDAAELKKWNDACETLGIDLPTLFRLQKSFYEKK